MTELGFNSMHIRNTVDNFQCPGVARIEKNFKNACLSRRYSQGKACRSRRIFFAVGVVATPATTHKRLTFCPILDQAPSPYKVLVQENLTDKGNCFENWF